MNSKAIERFVAKIDVLGPDECWLWQAARNPHGYGRSGGRGVPTLAHRIAYDLWVGPIPDGMVIRHTCGCPPCCNPSHLRIGTQGENVRDWVRDGCKPRPIFPPPTRPSRNAATLAGAVWPRVVKGDGCWTWLGEHGAGGYARLCWHKYPTRRAARAVYELTYGPTDLGMSLRSRCKNPRCVRPDHHFMGKRGGQGVVPIDVALWSRVVKGDGCWEWQGPLDVGGYGNLTNDGKQHRAHRIAYQLTKGEIPPGLKILHSCDNRVCCNPDHLRCGTDADNVHDMMSRGRHVAVYRPGELCANSKLKNQQVADIRRYYAAGVPMKQLASEYSVVYSTIYTIVRRKTWKHIA